MKTLNKSSDLHPFFFPQNATSEGYKLDHRYDIYSFCMIMWQILENRDDDFRYKKYEGIAVHYKKEVEDENRNAVEAYKKCGYQMLAYDLMSREVEKR